MLSLWSTRKIISALILRAFLTLSSRVSFTTGFGAGYRNLRIMNFTAVYQVFLFQSMSSVPEDDQRKALHQQ